MPDRLSGSVSRDERAPRSRPVSRRPIGIACALDQELWAIEALLERPRRGLLGPIAATRGSLAGMPVVLALTGVGKVDAAIAATMLCAEANVRALLSVGVAGALDADLVPGSIVVGIRYVQHDYGTLSDEGLRVYRAGQLPLPSVVPEPEPSISAVLEAAVRDALRELAGSAGGPAHGAAAPAVIRFGTIATGDAFVAGAGPRETIRERTGALAVEMEGAAVARVAARFGVPALVVRAISDRAGEASPTDFALFLPTAAAAAATVARRLVPVLAVHVTA